MTSDASATHVKYVSLICMQSAQVGVLSHSPICASGHVMVYQPAIFLLPSASHQQFTKIFALPHQRNKLQRGLEQTLHVPFPGPLVQMHFGFQTATSSCLNSYYIGSVSPLDPLLVFQTELKCQLQRLMLIFPWKPPASFIHAYPCPFFHQAVPHTLIFLVSRGLFCFSFAMVSPLFFTDHSQF